MSIWRLLEAKAYKQTGLPAVDIVFCLFFHANVGVWIGPEKFAEIIFKDRKTGHYYREDYECRYEDDLVIGEKIE